MDTTEYLKLAGVAAIISTSGALLALFLKDFMLTKYFEDRKEKKSIDTIYKRYKDPITLSAIELSLRLLQIHKEFPINYLTNEVLISTPSSLIKNSSVDEHYLRYKLMSTVFRLCNFLGWLELYRQEVTFLHSSSSDLNKKLEGCLQDIRMVFSEGRINKHNDWSEWNDSLIFREEQRAIGESMIGYFDKTKTIIGYAKFKIIAEEFIEKRNNDWLAPAFNFFLNPIDKKDFRKERYFLLLNHFTYLLETIDYGEAEKAIKKIKLHLEKSHG